MASLSHNNIGPQAGMAIAEAIKFNNTLNDLKSEIPPPSFLISFSSVAENNIGQAAEIAFCQALKMNPTLDDLR
jgi:hypothetical protein